MGRRIYSKFENYLVEFDKLPIAKKKNNCFTWKWIAL